MVFNNYTFEHRKLGLHQALVALAWNQESVILSDSVKNLRILKLQVKGYRTNFLVG